MRLLVTRPAASTPSPDAVHDVVATALRLAIARWSADLVRDAMSPRGAERIRGRMARFRLATFCTKSLQAACGLVNANPVLVGAALRDRLAASLDDVLAAEIEHVPSRVVQLLEHEWPEFLAVFAEEVAHGAHGGKTA
jgi:hypothetical protein